MMSKNEPVTKKPRRWLAPVIAAGVVLITVLVVVIVAMNAAAQSNAVLPPNSTPQVLREDSHRLDVAEDGKVTLVEFLDFECEACGAFYPFVEQLRAQYDGQITFVVRYFPIPSHRNSENAAIAAEAAAAQGQFEPMYSRLFETQAEWGEKQDPQSDLFRSYAQELGLDMDDYDAAVADPATKERVQKDFADGVAVGVEGTPTFFLNGEKLNPETTQDFIDAVDEALAQ